MYMYAISTACYCALLMGREEWGRLGGHLYALMTIVALRRVHSCSGACLLLPCPQALSTETWCFVAADRRRLTLRRRRVAATDCGGPTSAASATANARCTTASSSARRTDTHATRVAASTRSWSSGWEVSHYTRYTCGGVNTQLVFRLGGESLHAASFHPFLQTLAAV